MKTTSKIALINALMTGIMPENAKEISMVYNEQLNDEEYLKPVAQTKIRKHVIYYTDEKGNIRRTKK